MQSLQAGGAAAAGPAGEPPPVEYLAAVDRFLTHAALGAASRRVYRVSLSAWAWPLVGKPVPHGARNRGGPPPLVPLAVLDDAGTGARLAAAVAQRSAVAGPRTVNRELSALRSATAWWQAQQWIRTDPASGLRSRPAASGPASAPLAPGQVAGLLRVSPSLREHAFWRLLYDSGAPAGEVLALDIGRLDLARHRARPADGGPPADGGSPDGWIRWSPRTTELLRWLTAGRTDGPVFLSGRRAAPAAGPAGRCPVTGRARMSYRRAAEIFTAATRPLDPAGRGWTLQQLSHARRAAGRARSPARTRSPAPASAADGRPGKAPPAGVQPKKTSASA